MKTRRGISLLLALAMVFTLITVMPLSASATEYAALGADRSATYNIANGSIEYKNGTANGTEGTHDDPFVYHSNWNQRVGLIGFGTGTGLPNLTADEFITSAILTVTAQDITLASRVSVFGVDNTVWSETAYTAPATLGIPAYKATGGTQDVSAYTILDEKTVDKTAGAQYTFDVTDYVNANRAKLLPSGTAEGVSFALSNIIKPGEGTTTGEKIKAAFAGSKRETRPTLTITTAPAKTLTISFKDANGTELKTAATVQNIVGATIDLTDTDLVPASITYEGQEYLKVITMPTSHEIIDGTNAVDIIYLPDYLMNLTAPTDNVYVGSGTVAGVVYGNLTLPATAVLGDNEYPLVWTSSNVDVIANDGTYTRPTEDARVTMTATVTEGDYSVAKSYIYEADIVAKDGKPYTIKGANQISNPDFEEGFTGWTTTNFTADIVGGDTDGFVLDTAVAHTGSYSLAQRKNAGSGSLGSLSTRWEVTPGKTYALTFYAYDPSFSAIGWGYVASIDAEGAETMVIPNNGIALSSTWAKNTAVFTAGENTAYIGIKAGWITTVNFDDFALYEVEPIPTTATVSYLDGDGNALSGTPIEGATYQDYTSGTATQLDGLYVGDAYTVTPSSPIVLGENTYIYDTTKTNVASIEHLGYTANELVLNYRLAVITAAKYNGSAYTTRIGITPTLATSAVADIWLEGSDPATTEPAATVDVVWDSVDVSTPGTKTVEGTILGFNGKVYADVIVKPEYQAASFTQAVGSSISYGSNAYMSSSRNTSDVIITDADGERTCPHEAWFGSRRAPMITFDSLTATDGKAYILYVPVYMIDSGVNNNEGTIRITATYGEKHIVSLNAHSYSGTRETTKNPAEDFFMFDVTDAVEAGNYDFTLDSPSGAVAYPTFEMAAKGGIWEGCYPYIEEVDGVTLTGGAEVTKLTVAGNEVTSGATVAPGYGAKAYFETALTDYEAEVFVNDASVETLDETGATSYAIASLDDDTSVYFTITDTTPIPDPEITLTAAGVDGGVGTNGMGILRFVTGVAVPEGEAVEYYGTYIIPKAIFDGVTGSDETKITVKKTAAIADGKQYSADLKDIPSTMLDTEIYAWSFAKLTNHEDIAATVFTATSVNAAAAE